MPDELHIGGNAWEGAITVEPLLMDEPTAILAVVPGSDQPDRRSRT